MQDSPHFYAANCYIAQQPQTLYNKMLEKEARKGPNVSERMRNDNFNPPKPS